MSFFESDDFDDETSDDEVYFPRNHLGSSIRSKVTIGTFLSQKRQERKLGVRELGELAGLDVGTVSRIENDKTQPTFFSVAQLCKVLNVSSVEVHKALGKIKLDASKEPGSEQLRQDIFTRDELDKILSLYTFNQQRMLELLSKWLQIIFNSPKFEDATKNIPPLNATYIEQIVVGNPIYKIELQYPDFFAITHIIDLCQQGGTILPEDVGRYFGYVVQKPSVGEKSFIEAINKLDFAALDRVKFQNILTIDDDLQANGLVVSLFWSVVNWYFLYLADPQGYKFNRLVLILCRWLQYISDDDSWLAVIRSDIV